MPSESNGPIVPLDQRIAQLEIKYTALVDVLQAQDAVQTALLAKYEEQQKTLLEAAYAAEESAREIQGLKEAVKNLEAATEELVQRNEMLNSRLLTVAAGGSVEAFDLQPAFNRSRS